MPTFSQDDLSTTSSLLVRLKQTSVHAVPSTNGSATLTKAQETISNDIRVELLSRLEDLLAGRIEASNHEGPSSEIVIHPTEGPTIYLADNDYPNGSSPRDYGSVNDWFEPVNGFKTVSDALNFYGRFSFLAGHVRNNRRFLSSVNDYVICYPFSLWRGYRQITSKKQKVEITRFTRKFFKDRGFYFITDNSGDYYIALGEDNKVTEVASFDSNKTIASICSSSELAREYLTEYIKMHDWAHQHIHIHTATGYDPQGKLVMKSAVVPEDSDFSFPEFYPWFKDGMTEYFQEFMDSKAGVLLAIGDPGSGKSTFFRTVLRNCRLRALVVTIPEVFLASQFITQCLKLIEEHTVDVIICEDSDNYLRKRSDGNARMAELLNATSGIDTSACPKFVFTTNLRTIEDIDEALLRPGRCFDYLRFRPLTVAEAVIARKKIGLPAAKFGKRKEVSLAAALAPAVSQVNEGIIRPRFS